MRNLVDLYYAMWSNFHSLHIDSRFFHLNQIFDSFLSYKARNFISFHSNFTHLCSRGHFHDFPYEPSYSKALFEEVSPGSLPLYIQSYIFYIFLSTSHEQFSNLHISFEVLHDPTFSGRLYYLRNTAISLALSNYHKSLHHSSE